MNNYTCPKTKENISLWKPQPDIHMPIFEIPVTHVVVSVFYGCGGVVFSDGPKFSARCPDCGAGWSAISAENYREYSKKEEADFANWHPPLEFFAGF